MSKKIFISHSKVDEKIGEKLVDALVNMGIPQEIIFFSSKYHTGVGIGNDFSLVVKNALRECDIVIFLLTENFYRSEYCLNEMGAVWYSEKKFIPILLGDLSHDNMRGFIDSHYIAVRPNKEEATKLFFELKPYIQIADSISSPEIIFRDFIKESSTMVTDIKRSVKSIEKESSETEKNILKNRFTDDEIIFLNYFIEIGSNLLRDVTSYNYDTRQSEDSLEFKKFKAYCSKYVNFDYSKAKRLLASSSYLKELYYSDWEEDMYDGCEINIVLFRDLLSLSDMAKKYISEILTKHKKTDTSIIEECGLESLLLNNKLSEIEILLLAFMERKNQMTLGTRWMTAGTVSMIQTWEEESKIYSNKLSRNYENALKTLINRDMLEVASVTAYGNPREYRLKLPIIRQLQNLSPTGRLVLSKAIENNISKKPIDEIPF